jgi:hypothetical protein
MEAAMKYRKWTVLAMMIGWIASGAAWAAHGSHSGGHQSGGHHSGGHHSGGHHSGGHHFSGHSGFGVFIGPGFGWPWYYGSAYYLPYYYDYDPPVYVDQEDAVAPVPQSSAPSQQPDNWWYYCQKTQSYYPYLKECAGGWLRVAPQPSPR